MNQFETMFNDLQATHTAFIKATCMEFKCIKNQWYVCHHLVVESGFDEVIDYTFTNYHNGYIVTTQVLRMGFEQACYTFAQKAQNLIGTKVTVYIS